MPPRIIFLRHGETDWNAEQRLQGQRDIPLNGRGRNQASAVGAFLRSHLAAEAPLDAAFDFVASPLIRTRDTMRLAREAMGLDPERYALDPRLVELSFGRWEGLTWQELKARDPSAARGREGDKWNFTPPGGESYQMLADRIKPWLDELERDTLVVSHGGVARVLMAMIGGLTQVEAPMADVRQGRALLFENGACGWL